jgi:hypothetical protein
MDLKYGVRRCAPPLAVVPRSTLDLLHPDQRESLNAWTECCQKILRPCAAMARSEFCSLKKDCCKEMSSLYYYSRIFSTLSLSGINRLVVLAGNASFDSTIINPDLSWNGLLHLTNCSSVKSGIGLRYLDRLNVILCVGVVTKNLKKIGGYYYAIPRHSAISPFLYKFLIIVLFTLVYGASVVVLYTSPSYHSFDNLVLDNYPLDILKRSCQVLTSLRFRH